MMSKEVKVHLPISGRSRLNHLLPVWRHIWPILALILVPLLLLAGIGASTLGLITLVRAWTAGDAFFVQQLYLLLVVSMGLILAVVTYTITIIRALRKIRA